MITEAYTKNQIKRQKDFYLKGYECLLIALERSYDSVRKSAR